MNKKQCVKINLDHCSSVVSAFSFQIVNSELNLTLHLEGKDYSVDDISIVYYRQGPTYEKVFDYYNKLYNNQQISSFIAKEYLSFLRFLYLLIPTNKWVNHPSYQNLPKIKQLHLAIKSGFSVPDTYITSDIESINIDSESEDYIIKPIDNFGFFESDSENVYATYTSKFDRKLLNRSKGFPSTIQTKIRIKDELRVFVWYDYIYAVKIFYDKNEDIVQDFRNYSNNKFYLFTYYKISNKLRDKVLKFMNQAFLNTASIDIIIDVTGKHFFLDANPAGQFGFISGEMNIDLHEVIASYLIKVYDSTS